MKLTYPKSIPEAAAALDTLEPGWYNRVDIDTLDMTKNCRCILGQLTGQWYNGITIYFEPQNNKLSFRYINYDTIFGGYADRDAWIEEIKKRVSVDDMERILS